MKRSSAIIHLTELAKELGNPGQGNTATGVIGQINNALAFGGRWLTDGEYSGILFTVRMWFPMVWSALSRKYPELEEGTLWQGPWEPETQSPVESGQHEQLDILW